MAENPPPRGAESFPYLRPSLRSIIATRAADFIDFLGTAFAGSEVLRTLEIAEAQREFQPMPCHLHVYVTDTEVAYARALEAGGTSIETPQDKPYGDRSAGVKDAWGNSWFITTYPGETRKAVPA